MTTQIKNPQDKILGLQSAAIAPANRFKAPDAVRFICRCAFFGCVQLLLLSASLVQGAGTNMPTIFVATISASPNIPNFRASTGKSIAETLLTELASSTKIHVLETSEIETLKNEIKMGKDGWMEPDMKTEKGHWLGADYMLTAKLTMFDRPPKTEGAKKGFFDSGAKMGRVQLLWRVVNTSTRSVVGSGTADSNRNRKKFSLVNTAKNIVGASDDESEAMDRAMNLALAQIVAEVELLDLGKTDRITLPEPPDETGLSGPRRITGTVDAVKPDFLIVSVGSKHGCKPGDKFELCETVPIKNKEGKTVFEEQKVVGDLEITMCLEERSKANYSSLVAPMEGWIVRQKSSSQKPPQTVGGRSLN